jgi:hypothetical protein
MEAWIMDDRQKKLVEEFGPRFRKRCVHIETEFLYLVADAASVLTDAEFKECGKAIEKVMSELNRVREIAVSKMIEVEIKD